MLDLVYRLPRSPLPRTPVNKGKKKRKGRRVQPAYRKAPDPEREVSSTSKVVEGRKPLTRVRPPGPGGSPSQASELLQMREVLRTRLFAFQPLHVTLKPQVATLLGTLSGQAHLPVSRRLVAVGTFRQFSELAASIGLGDSIHRGFEGLSGQLEQGFRLAPKDFLDHL